MGKINIAITGVGNCASSLVQGIHYYKDKNSKDVIGLMHWEIGGYTPGDIEVVAAFDIDRGEGGVLAAPSAYFCKHPPRQFTDDEAFHMMENFIHKYQDKVREISDYQQREGYQISTRK